MVAAEHLTTGMDLGVEELDPMVEAWSWGNFWKGFGYGIGIAAIGATAIGVGVAVATAT